MARSFSVALTVRLTLLKSSIQTNKGFKSFKSLKRIESFQSIHDRLYKGKVTHVEALGLLLAACEVRSSEVDGCSTAST